MYKVYEQVSNACGGKVFESDSFYEVQDYLTQRFEESDCDNEELFYSYFRIIEGSEGQP